MKGTLKPGLKVERRFRVDEGRVITFLGGGAPAAGQLDLRVYATPAMIRDIEQTCRDFLLDHLDEGEDSLGTLVNVQHLAPTLRGMEVIVTAEIAALDGKAVTFTVTVGDAVDAVVGKGTHQRFIVEIAKVGQRLAAKAAKVGLAP